MRAHLPGKFQGSCPKLFWALLGSYRDDLSGMPNGIHRWHRRRAVMHSFCVLSALSSTTTWKSQSCEWHLKAWKQSGFAMTVLSSWQQVSGSIGAKETSLMYCLSLITMDLLSGCWIFLLHRFQIVKSYLRSLNENTIKTFLRLRSLKLWDLLTTLFSDSNQDAWDFLI